MGGFGRGFKVCLSKYIHCMMGSANGCSFLQTKLWLVKCNEKW